MPEQLSPQLYAKVNEVLSALGAQWDKKRKGHELAYDISEDLERILETGVYYNWKKDTEFFPTPPEVLRFMDHMIPYEHEEQIKILEPSAGEGNILDYLKEEFPNAELHAVEINPLHVRTLNEKGYDVVCRDFLEYCPDMPFDLIVMNPPFNEGLRHIMHAYDLLKPNGSIVSVMAAGVKFRSTGVFKEWNRFLRGKYHSMIDLPKNAFKGSGTGINTVLVGLTRFDTCLQYHVYEYNERKTIEISNVPDEMYGITTAIVDAERFMKGQKYFPCASGNNIALTEEMKQEIRKLLDMEKVHAA